MTAYTTEQHPVHGRILRCRTCGSFRTNGQPPTVHRTGYGCGPDPSEAGLIGYGTHHLHTDPTPAPGEHPRRQPKLDLSKFAGAHRTKRR